MIIEFLGPNGSGKSTVLRHLVPALRSLELTVDLVDLDRNVPETSRWAASVRNPRLVIAALRERDRGMHVRHIVLRDAVKLPGRAEAHILLDEGPRHRLLSTAAMGGVEHPARLLAAMRKPDRIVSLSASIDVLLQRCRQKPERHWTRRCDDHHLEDHLRRYLEIRDQYLERTNVPVTRCDTGTDVVEHVAVTLVETILNRPAPPGLYGTSTKPRDAP